MAGARISMVCFILATAAACASEGPGPDDQWPELPFAGRVLANRGRPVECGEGSACPAGQKCFRLTEDLGFCDVEEPEQPMGCAGNAIPLNPAEDCGCAGSSCGADQRCVATEHMCSCMPTFTNHCVDAPCRSAEDCPEGSACRPTSFIFWPMEGTARGWESGRCVKTGCQSDADCILVPNGRCGVMLNQPPQQGETTLSNVICFYAMRDGDCPTGTLEYTGPVGINGRTESVCAAL